MASIYSRSINLHEGIVNTNLAKDSIDQAIILSESLNSVLASKLIENAKIAFDGAFQSAILLIALIMIGLGIFAVRKWRKSAV